LSAPEPIPATAPEIAAEVDAVIRRLGPAIDDAVERMLGPSDWEAEAAYRVTARHLFQVVRITLTQLQSVRRSLATSAPGWPLEVVLADIEAEGHPDIRLSRTRQASVWSCETATGTEEYWDLPSLNTEAFLAWERRVEHGIGIGPTIVAAAKARLGQIRALHAKALSDAPHNAVIAAEEALRVSDASEEHERAVALAAEIAFADVSDEEDDCDG